MLEWNVVAELRDSLPRLLWLNFSGNPGSIRDRFEVFIEDLIYESASVWSGSCMHSPLGRPLPALRLRPGVSLAVDQLGLLRLEGGRARDVVRVEGEHVDPVAVALQRPAQRAVRRAPHLDGAVLR